MFLLSSLNENLILFKLLKKRLFKKIYKTITEWTFNLIRIIKYIGKLKKCFNFTQTKIKKHCGNTLQNIAQYNRSTTGTNLQNRNFNFKQISRYRCKSFVKLQLHIGYDLQIQNCLP